MDNGDTIALEGATYMKNEDMTPAQRAKHHGLDSLTEMEDLSFVSRATLKRWAIEKPERFDLIAMGCIAKKCGFTSKAIMFLHETAKTLKIIEESKKDPD